MYHYGTEQAIVRTNSYTAELLLRVMTITCPSPRCPGGPASAIMARSTEQEHEAGAGAGAGAVLTSRSEVSAAPASFSASAGDSEGTPPISSPTEIPISSKTWRSGARGEEHR